jgi:ribosome production factor 1
MKNPSKIRNKIKRTEIYSKYKSEKKQQKKKLRQERLKEVEELGESAPPKQAPRTIENTRFCLIYIYIYNSLEKKLKFIRLHTNLYARRIHDETTVKPDDVEVFEEERSDEFSKYFSNEVKPKIMISTRPKCSRKLFPFIADLMQMIPNAFYYPRGTLSLHPLSLIANTHFLP